MPTFDHAPDVPARDCHCTAAQFSPPLVAAVSVAVAPTQMSGVLIVMDTCGSATTVTTT